MNYVTRLSESQCRQALIDSHALWGGGRTLEDRWERTHRLMADPAGLLCMSGLVDEAGQVPASLKLYRLALQTPAGVLEAVGLGAIFTAEASRRQGLAERLIRSVLAEAYAGGAGAALLFSDIDPAYYERFGFTRLSAHTGRGAAADLPAQGAFATRPAGPGDAPRLRAWYDASFTPVTVHPRRDAAAWDFYRKLNATGPDLILTGDGADAGFISVCFEADLLWVEEWGAPGVPDARVWATVRRLAEEKGLSQVGAWLEPEHAPTGIALQPRPKAVPMLAARPGVNLMLPPEAAWFGSLDHF